MQIFFVFQKQVQADFYKLFLAAKAKMVTFCG